MPERQWRTAARLAWSEFRHEWTLSACQIFALAAVLAPLLVLFGLRWGIVSTLTERLRADPTYRELILRGNRSLGPDWFASLARDPRVGFLVPRTRSLSASVSLTAPAGNSLIDIDMIPTAPGDPWMQPTSPAPTGMTEIVLSHTAARALGVGRGENVEALITRRLKGVAQAARLELRVADVLKESALARDAVLVSLELLIAAEDYRDGLAVPELGAADGEATKPAVRSFASARLYASTLHEVAPLADTLRSQGITVVTHANEIANVAAINRVLTLVFVVLAALGVAGYAISLAVSLWANVERKRREIAILRLLGLRKGPVIGFPALQAVFVAVGGLALSMVFYVGVSALFNQWYQSYLGRDEFVCRLLPIHLCFAAGATVLLALSAAVAAGYSATNIDPAESLREP